MKKFSKPFNLLFSIFLIVSSIIFSLTSPFVILIVPGLAVSPYLNGFVEKFRTPISVGKTLGTIIFGCAFFLFLLNYYTHQPTEKSVHEEKRFEEQGVQIHNNDDMVLQSLTKNKNHQDEVNNETVPIDKKEILESTIQVIEPKTDLSKQKDVVQEEHLSTDQEPILSSLSLPKNEIVPLCYGTVHTKGSSLNIRKGMGRNTQVIYKVPKGSSLQLFGSDHHQWYKVQLEDGTIGYVSKDYVKIDQNNCAAYFRQHDTEIKP